MKRGKKGRWKRKKKGKWRGERGEMERGEKGRWKRGERARKEGRREGELGREAARWQPGEAGRTKAHPEGVALARDPPPTPSPGAHGPCPPSEDPASEQRGCGQAARAAQQGRERTGRCALARRPPRGASPGATGREWAPGVEARDVGTQDGPLGGSPGALTPQCFWGAWRVGGGHPNSPSPEVACRILDSGHPSHRRRECALFRSLGWGEAQDQSTSAS